ncbi:MAG: hypothetical protein IT175_14005 [Acidobacteria bacterium]|nr:hypothetical protein [Acidobacteriota bacterium]
MTSVTDNSRPLINKIQGLASVVMVLGVLAIGAGFSMEPETIYQSYLIGWLFWNGIAVGFLGLLMLHHVVGGDWGFVNRRFLEAGAMTAIVTGVLCIPILLGLPHLYEWANPAKVASEHVLHEKAPYLNTGFFYGRVAFYFLFWAGSAVLLNVWSADVDKTGSHSFRVKARLLSAPGLLVYVLVYTFYSIDFAMSLETHWMSSIFALLMMVGGALSTLSILVILMWRFQSTEPLSKVLVRARFHDVGNLMLAFTMLWAYMAFSQYLIGWAGNLPEEAGFYSKRLSHGFMNVAVALVVLHFVLPFFLLLLRPIKKAPAMIAMVGILFIVMRHVDLWWFVKPAFDGQPGSHFAWTDVAVTVGMGGIWLFAFCLFLKSKLILPVYESHHDRPPVKHEVYLHG